MTRRGWNLPFVLTDYGSDGIVGGLFLLTQPQETNTAAATSQHITCSKAMGFGAGQVYTCDVYQENNRLTSLLWNHLSLSSLST
jgi:hypothetical protein